MRRVAHLQIELQIAPMIDVCFLLLFFYILTSKPVTPEADLGMTLPGTVAQSEEVSIPDEQRIVIDGRGTVILNDLAVGGAKDRDLRKLTETLVRFKATAAANKAEALVSIDADDASHHQRIVDVLNSCALAGIQGVTFADSEGGEQ